MDDKDSQISNNTNIEDMTTSIPLNLGQGLCTRSNQTEMC
jgi:hypothetical protein